MKQEIQINQQWVDIINPLPAQSDALLVWLLVLSCILLFSLIAQLIWRRRPRQILRREIKWLIDASSVRPKDRLRLLEQSICRYYNTNLLSQVPINHPDWQTFITQLQMACYQRKTMSQTKTRKLLLQAQNLLKEFA